MSRTITAPCEFHTTTLSSVLQSLNSEGIALVAGFPVQPPNPHELVAYLRPLGEPLVYYGDDAGSDPDEPSVWRVKYDEKAAARGEGHAVAGRLKLHSSQSARDPRPRYFAMLMVDMGWQDLEAGSNGESVLGPWADALALLAEEDPAGYQATLAVLSSPLPFPDGVDRPLVYDLPTRQTEFDFGVRMKNGLDSFLAAHAPESNEARAVAALQDAAERTAPRIQLRTGDLVVIDNDRWGHGRERVVGERSAGGSASFNPRELWSLTLA